MTEPRKERSLTDDEWLWEHELVYRGWDKKPVRKRIRYVILGGFWMFTLSASIYAGWQVMDLIRSYV